MNGKSICIKIGLCLLFSFLVWNVSGGYVLAADHPILYFFWGEGCPHCEKEKEFLKKLHQHYPELEMRWFETWKHPEFTQLADAMRHAYHLNTSSVPMTFLGNWNITGFRSDDITGIEIEQQVIACIEQGCFDGLRKLGPRNIVWLIQDQAARKKPIGWEQYPASIPPRSNEILQIPRLIQVQSETAMPVPQTSPSEQSSSVQPSEISAQPAVPASKAEVIEIPIIKKRVALNISQIGLPLFTLIIGGLDGFNPCAMWVLSFLLTLVIYAKSRTKILLIGGIFVIASGIIYFLFMTAWLNIFIFVGYVKWLRIAVGFVAIVMGIINCKDFFFFQKGVSLTIPESAKPKLYKRMRAVIHTSAIPGVILGTIVLAVTANLIELLCTAGFPAIYTNILTTQNLSVIQYYLYLVLYNVIYVIPLAVIVGIFAWKMGGRKVTEKEGRILKLVGGLLMLALGLILLIKPQLLMFG
ncbi:membrane protein, putative [Candidatus Vecturithrix granuli]|uniref:Membrane protein, putative n=1 Tax=Vecturithrix granuli TaxID=1499967 RepID=A0A081C644_VECG1|nr:membrane protein, putative [Candidatus Vecturithrix granuli]